MGIAVLVGAAASLPAVRLQPLHVDEAITLEFAPESFPAILRDIFVERGGAPVFFLVEHLSLQWPGGVVGLRLPSVLCFLAAVVLSAPVADRLGGRDTALFVPVLLALAPLAVQMATFARMYTLFLAAVLLVVWLLLGTVRDGGRTAWIVTGGLAGGLVYVHPIAPLYIGAAFATAFLHSGASLRPFLRRARSGFVALAVVALPYVYALAVLSRRYGVASPESSVFGGDSEYPVPVESLRSLAGPDWPLTVVLGTLAVTGLITMLRGNRRTGVALALWIAIPVGFFSLVPSETSFYPRYLLPALPFFLLLVAEGCLAAGRLVRRPLVGATALVSVIAVWQAVETVSRHDRLREFRLSTAVEAVADVEDPVLFSSVGTPLGGRPALLLDAYADLELPEVIRVEELPTADPAYLPDVGVLGAAELRKFLAGPQRPGRGIWMFGGMPDRLDRAERRLRTLPEVDVRRASPVILVVGSREALDPHSLVEQAIDVRQAWLGPNGRDRWSRLLIDIERRATDAES